VSTKPKYVSMASEDMKEGSNLFDNVDARIKNIQFTKEPPSDSYTTEGNPIFSNVTFLLDGDGPEAERTVSQSYSLGAQAGDNFTIGDDGYGLLLIEGKDDAAIRKDSKWGTFVAVLETSGVSKAITQAGDMEKLVGLYGHFKRVADKARDFGEDARTRPGQKKSKFPPSTLVCVKLLAMPGEKVKDAPATKTASAPTTTATAPATNGNTTSTSDLDGVTSAYLETVLKAAKGPVQRSNLTLLLSRAAVKEANRQDIARRGADEGFLTELAGLGLIAYDPAAKPQVVSLTTS